MYFDVFHALVVVMFVGLWALIFQTSCSPDPQAETVPEFKVGGAVKCLIEVNVVFADDIGAQ